MAMWSRRATWWRISSRCCAAGAAVAGSTSGTDLLGAAGKRAVAEALAAAIKRLTFSTGLQAMPPFDLNLASPSLESARKDSMLWAARKQRMEQAMELAEQFQKIRSANPQLSPGDVLRQLSPADQGTMLQTLLLASGREKETQAAWVAAGPVLLQVNLSKTPPTAQAISLPTALGPLRSVQLAQNGSLLIGVRGGVMVLDPARPGDVRSFADGSITSQLGFSRALMWNEQVWGCHGEAGIVCWSAESPSLPAFVLRPLEIDNLPPRNLAALDESRLIFSAKNKLMVLHREMSEKSVTYRSQTCDDLGAEPVAILPDSDRVVVVLGNGVVQVRDKQTLAVQQSGKRCGAAASAALLPWLGSTRLLIGTEEGPVLGIGLEDDLVTQYASPYRGMKALAATADLVFALSEDRQHLVFWKSWAAREPAGQLYIASIARHRAADIEV